MLLALLICQDWNPRILRQFGRPETVCVNAIWQWTYQDMEKHEANSRKVSAIKFPGGVSVPLLDMRHSFYIPVVNIHVYNGQMFFIF